MSTTTIRTATPEQLSYLSDLLNQLVDLGGTTRTAAGQALAAADTLRAASAAIDRTKGRIADARHAARYPSEQVILDGRPVTVVTDPNAPFTFANGLTVGDTVEGRYYDAPFAGTVAGTRMVGGRGSRCEVTIDLDSPIVVHDRTETGTIGIVCDARDGVVRHGHLDDYRDYVRHA